MPTTLFVAAVRGGALLAVVWVLLKALRLRDPAVEKNTCTLVVAAAVVMPLLSWVAAMITPPLRVLPLTVLPSRPVASTAALANMASGDPRTPIALICAWVYTASATVLLTRFATGLWIGQRLRRRASKVNIHGEAMDVRVCTSIHSPASFASTILLPPAYATWDTATLATVLAHEQAHILNRDCYRLWLAALYRAVFWFDPLSYWLHWRLRVLSELTSDEAAAAAVGDRAAYAATLQNMARAPQLIPSTVAMADSRTLGRRLQRLMQRQEACAPLTRSRRMLLTSVVLVMVVLAMAPWARAMVPVAQGSATLEFHLVDDQNNAYRAQQSGQAPAGDKLYEMTDGTPILLERKVVVTGDEVTEATTTITSAGPVVDVNLDQRGAASMLRITSQNVGHRMAAVYNGRVINDAVIRGAFGRQFQVTGLTAAEARVLALQFRQAPPPVVKPGTIVVTSAQSSKPPAPVLAPLVKARLTYAPDPGDFYPEALRRNNEQGGGRVHICIDKRGHVSANVARSTGDTKLDDQMLKFANAVRIQPATRGGEPVKSCLTMPMRFVLPWG